MLHSLNLHNFALIDELDISFDKGFNVITGETGAGKSLILDALSLCAGGRADSGMVRHGQAAADLYAEFESTDEQVQAWFDEHHRPYDGSILIRRQLSENGRSKAWLNGVPVSLAELKSLGAMLVSIHSQHAGLELLKPQFALGWLDKVGGLTAQADSTKAAYRHWQNLHEQQQKYSEEMTARLDRIDLLTGKLADIAPLLGVAFDELEKEYEELSNAETLIQSAWQIAQILDNDSDEPSALSLLARAIKNCENHSEFAVFAQNYEQLTTVQSILIDVQAALADYAENQSLSPERLAELDELMALAHRLSNKYRTPIDELIVQAGDWQAELDELVAMPDVKTLESQVKVAFDAYVNCAMVLHKAREKVAPTLCQSLMDNLAPLALPNAVCEFCFTKKDEKQYSASGIFEVELLFSANVGMPLQPLHKVASGGELSRIALVMQVLSADNHQNNPMLVFDEVDVGISGGTAQVVGELLRKLGKHGQLLAITHQAQVAAAAHQHILVKKHHDKQTTSSLVVLNKDERIAELARMVGGVDITKTTLAHAKSLLTASQTNS